MQHLQAAAKANDGDEKLQQQMQELQLISLKYQQEARRQTMQTRIALRACRPIIRSSMVRLWRAKICRSILPLLPPWRRWHSYISGMMGLFFDWSGPGDL